MLSWSIHRTLTFLLTAAWLSGAPAQVLTVRPMPAVQLVADVLVDVNQVPKPGDLIGPLEQTRLTVNAPAWQEADRELERLISDLRTLLPKHLAGLPPQQWDVGYGPASKRQRIIASYLASTKSEGMGDPGASTTEDGSPDLDSLFSYAPVLRLVPKQLLLQDFLLVQSEFALRNLLRRESFLYPDIPASLPNVPFTLQIPRGRTSNTDQRDACAETVSFIETILAKVPSSSTVQSFIRNVRSAAGIDAVAPILVVIKALKQECLEYEGAYDRHRKAIESFESLSLRLFRHSDGHTEYAVDARRKEWYTEERLLKEGFSRGDIANLPKRWVPHSLKPELDEFFEKLKSIGLTDQERKRFLNAVDAIVAFSRDNAYLGTYIQAVDYVAPPLYFPGKLFRAVSDWYYVADESKDWQFKLSSSDRMSVYNRLVSRLNDADREYFLQIRDAALGTTGAVGSAIAQSTAVSARVRLEAAKRRIHEDVIDALANARSARERTMPMASTNWSPEVGALVASVHAEPGKTVQPGTVLLTALPANARTAVWKAAPSESIVGQVFNVQFVSPPDIPLPPNFSSSLSWNERRKVTNLLSDISEAIYKDVRLTLTVTPSLANRGDGEALGVLEHAAATSYDVSDLIASSAGTQEPLELLARAGMAYRVDGRVLFRPACGLIPIEGKVSVKLR